MSMVVFHSRASQGQNPQSFFRHGRLVAHPETSQRYSVLLDALQAERFEVRVAEDYGLDPINQVHDHDYVDFLSSAWSRRAELGVDTDEMLATQFPRRGMEARPNGLQGLLGFYLGDTSTGIRHDTWETVRGSAHAAVAAADFAVRSIGPAYALCRPPGHHAYAGYAGGFCYLNNAAIAAQRMRSSLGKPVAVLDIDVHHGNGTQGIFYERSDILTVSIHADTRNYFPHYSGHVDETGGGEGRGYNLNLPIPHRSGDETWLEAVRAGLARVQAFAPGGLVVSLGLDASIHDPIGALSVTTEGFRAAGRLIGQFAGPITWVQEGGYLCDELSQNLIAVLRGAESAQPPAVTTIQR